MFTLIFLRLGLAYSPFLSSYGVLKGARTLDNVYLFVIFVACCSASMMRSRNDKLCDVNVDLDVTILLMRIFMSKMSMIAF